MTFTIKRPINVSNEKEKNLIEFFTILLDLKSIIAYISMAMLTHVAFAMWVFTDESLID
jgi:hypothetical protein